MKYSLSLREIPRAKPEGFPKEKSRDQQDLTFLLLQQTAVQSSILFLSRTVDKILQTCSVVKD